MNTSIIAEIKHNKPQLSDYQRTKLNKAFALNEGKMIQITVGNIKKERSGQQNKFYWGVILKELAIHTGYSEEELHEVLKYKFLPRNFVTVAGEEVEIRKGTSKLSTVEFEAFIERVRCFASTELQIELPMPGENQI